MKNIIILGDSFTYGEGCSDRSRDILDVISLGPSDFCWAALLQKELPEYNFINLSKPGNSIMGMLMDIIKFKENVSQINIDLVLMSATSHQRMLVPEWSDPDVTTNWVIGSPALKSEPEDFANAKESFIKYLINDEIVSYNGLAHLMALNFYCQNLCGSTMIWSLPKARKELITYKKGGWNTIWSTYFDHQFELSYVGSDPDKKLVKELTCEDGHPNDAGHSHYFETYLKLKLIPMIKEFIRK